MLSEKEFCEEALAVLKWLIAIPSITRTAGDEIINQTIYNTVSEFTYFKSHPEYLNFITHDDQKNHSFTAFVRRDAFLDVVFLWYTPLEVALSIVEIAFNKAASAAALSFAAIAASTFLIAVLTPDLIDLFLAALVSLTRILFFADLMLANFHTSDLINDNDFLKIYAIAGHGRANVNTLI